MKRLLIANRGEVALRILRSAHELGLQTVLIYSEADKHMEYLNLADEIVQIGPAHASKSYLNIETIISTALTWKANAIHPGYGFLSENPTFAARCEEHGLAFVGPSSTVLRTIGNKSRTKEVAQKLGIPSIPGSRGVLSNVEHAILVAHEIGFPIMLKSLYGGGGRGMKIAQDEAQLQAQFNNVSSEANAAFGRSEIYIERYVHAPRHLEVQILADRYGNIKILGDRECSIQRRHQKIIEEAPIPNISDATRTNIWEWSTRIVQSLEFEGLGTVEFLLDQEENIYFLEINGRLQVEHPVTEMITDIDMVAEQILVRAGMELTGDAPRISGHAIECRLNAEDPNINFMPTTGKIGLLQLPGGPGVRVDTHIFRGCEISSYYDSLIAKIITHHSNRPQVLKRMLRSLNETNVQGLVTNKDFLLKLLKNERFQEGRSDTSLVMEVLKQ